jgi:hydrogenase assembly chaperone HypC/HupF
MCLTQPAKVVACSEHEVLVEVGGRRQIVSNLLVPDVRVGDDVLIGLGSVLAGLSPAEASSLREIFDSAAGAEPIHDPDLPPASPYGRPAAGRV